MVIGKQFYDGMILLRFFNGFFYSGSYDNFFVAHVVLGWMEIR